MRQQQHVLCQVRAQRQRRMQPIRPTNVHSAVIDVVATANRQVVGGRCEVQTFSQRDKGANVPTLACSQVVRAQLRHNSIPRQKDIY